MGICAYRLDSANRKIDVCRILAVIASQFANWRGNPPVRGEKYRQLPYGAGNLAIFGGNRNLVPLNRGIATPLKRTGLAMTELLRQTPIYRLAASDSGGFEISYRRISSMHRSR